MSIILIKANPDKISGFTQTEKDNRFGDSFTRNVRKAHIVNNNNMTIVRSQNLKYNNKGFIQPSLPFNTFIEYNYNRFNNKAIGKDISKMFNKDIINKVEASLSTQSKPKVIKSKLDGLRATKDIILNELNSKSVSIKFNFGYDESYIRVNNNNIDLTIKDPSTINLFKKLLIKSLK